MNFDSPTPIGRSAPKRESRPSQKRDVALPLPDNDNNEVSGVHRRPDFQEEDLVFSDEEVEAAIAESEALSKTKRPPPIPPEALRAKTTPSSPQYRGRLKMAPPPVTEEIKASSLRNKMSPKDMEEVHASLNRVNKDFNDARDSDNALSDLDDIRRTSFAKEAARLLDPGADVELAASKRRGPYTLDRVAKHPSERLSADEAQDALASLDRFNDQAKAQKEADLSMLQSIYKKISKFTF